MTLRELIARDGLDPFGTQQFHRYLDEQVTGTIPASDGSAVLTKSVVMRIYGGDANVNDPASLPERQKTPVAARIFLSSDPELAQ